MPRMNLLLPLMLIIAMPAPTQNRATDAGARGALLLVANKGDHTVGLIDPLAGRQIATIDFNGVTGHELVASPDGRFAYVPIYGNSGVGQPGTDGSNLVVVDLVARKIAGNVDFGHGVRPHCIRIGPHDGLLYVTTELDQAITVIDPRTLKIAGKIPTTQPESHMLAISRDGRRGYAVNVGPGNVSVLDLENRKSIVVIPVAPRIQRIALSIDDRLVFTADQSQPQLAVIDTATNKLKNPIPLPGIGYGAAPTPDGRWLVVPIHTGNQVVIVDLDTMKVARSIAVPAVPQEVLIAPDGHAAYVSCDVSHKVAVIRTSDWTVEKLIDVGPSADGLAWAAAK